MIKKLMFIFLFILNVHLADISLFLGKVETPVWIMLVARLAKRIHNSYIKIESMEEAFKERKPGLLNINDKASYNTKLKAKNLCEIPDSLILDVIDFLTLGLSTRFFL